MKWIEPPPLLVPEDLLTAVGGHPLVAEVLARRGVVTPSAARAFLDPEAYAPAEPYTLPGMERAVARIQHALERGERICVWGDFDVDGQTATTILVSVLRELKADVVYHIPVRMTESHGLSLNALRNELDRGVRLILTCDTGIDAHEAVAYAKAQGVDVVVTDHHELPAALPDAEAIINPHLLDVHHPLRTLPGVGVAFKVAEALFQRLGRPVEELASYLDLVALGIVADVAELRGDTRYLLQRGLKVLRAAQRLGLRVLCEVAGIEPVRLTEEDIGFGLAPRLNALGRLGDASSSVELLTTHDLAHARMLAYELEALNVRRKMLCDQTRMEAEKKLAEQPEMLEAPVLVLSDPGWHVGVIGIVANQLAARYERPVILLSVNPEGMAQGSARSVPGCHITNALATQADLLESFGGHAMAAGLAIRVEHLDRFRRGVTEAVAHQLALSGPGAGLEIHGYVSLAELTLPFLQDLSRLAPFGPGNPRPVLAVRNVRIVRKRQLGEGKHHLRLTIEDRDGVARDVLWWEWRGAMLPEGLFDLAFAPYINWFQNRPEVRLEWRDAHAVAPIAPLPVVRTLEVLDWRQIADPLEAVVSLGTDDGSVVVWAEGKVDVDIGARVRTRVTQADTLVVWSIPPDLSTFHALLRRVNPTRVVFVCRATVDHGVRAFLRALAARTKYVINRAHGYVELAELAASVGQREASVRLGLGWLEARGRIVVLDSEPMAMRLMFQTTPGEGDLKLASEILAKLKAVLQETSAFRRHFMLLPLDKLRDYCVL